MKRKGWIVVLLLIFSASLIFAATCGDVNSSGIVDILDALLIAQKSAGLSASNYDSSVADVSGDSKIDIVDALLVARYAAGLISQFEGCVTVIPTPTPTPAKPQTVFAVNCGGAAYTSSDGTSFAADAGFTGGSTYTNTSSISGTQDDTLYQSERYGDFTYSAAVSNGYYLVTLYFAETYLTSTGSRQFDVLMEGKEEISNLDIYAKAGSNTAYTTETYVTVSDGEITIKFVSGVENAKVNAIKVAIAGPAAAFSYSPAKPLPAQSISFDASASSDSNGTITAYAWTFGDGGSGTGKTTTHTYTTAGNYQVTLKITDNDGNTGSVTKTLTVYTGEPVADFSINPSAPKPGEAMTVDASASSDPDGTISAYAWTFGDGSSGTGKTATHTYTTAGSYQVTLKVTDNDGKTGSVTKTVTVSASTGSAEDSGLDLQVGSPSGSNGGSSSVLPDPFTRWNGTQVKTMADWRYRRRELVVEIEKRILGQKAPPPAKIGGTVTGSISTSSYSVSVKNPNGSCSFSGTVSVPSTGKAPYPAVIVIGGISSLNSDVLSSEGVATISYDAYTLAAETSGNFTSGKYFDANPDFKGKTGGLVAWAWGVSRIIDMLEKNPGVIDPTKIAIHGCSRFGKAAFVIGAFDERIALGLPTEPGTGGPAPLRSLSSVSSGGQPLSSCISEANWFGPMAGSYSASMAVDMSDVACMYAPRGLLLMDNPTIAWLSFQSNYLGCAAAAEVYKAMGKSDALWYLGNTSNGSHCSVRSEYGPALRAMVQKFLKNNTSATTGGLNASSSHGNINVSGWTSSWKKGTISQ